MVLSLPLWIFAPLLLLLAAATVTDVLRHRIYNWQTYPGILLGIALNTVHGGWSGLQESVAGFLVCGLIMLVCFVFFDMGGGDLKLVAMMGAFLGLHVGFEAMLWTFVIGSIMGLAILIWKFGAGRLVLGTLRHLWLVVRTGGWVPLEPQEREPLRRWLFLAPAALLAVLVMAANDHYHWW